MAGDAARRRQSAFCSGTRATARKKMAGVARRLSAPAEPRGDIFQDHLDDMSVVVDTKLIGDGQEQRVGRSDSFVLRELLDEDIRLGSVAAAENGATSRRCRLRWSGNGFAVAVSKGIVACTSMISTSRLSKSQTARSA